MHLRTFWLAIALSLTLSHAGNAVASDALRGAVSRLGGEPCPQSALTCVDLSVPLDRTKPGTNARINVRFAISFATEESKGILFFAVGGPGGSGLAVADSYLATFDPRLAQEMDVVFFDQRGVGPENGIDCPKAGLTFDMTSFSLAKPDAAVAAAKGFAAACARETPHLDLLPHVATDMAAQDLEDFRLALGSPKVWFYGESYGTQLGQAYAARYPQALKGLILDGVIDPALDAEAFYEQDVRTAEKLLQKTFDSCDTDAACHADMGAPAGQIYDDLAAKLADAPLSVAFPLANGSLERREMTTAILETVAFYALYETNSRMGFLRALAASTKGNLVPLLRLGYGDLDADPQTIAPEDDPSWFGGAYFAITCPDYDDAGRDPLKRTQQILEQARKLAPETPRLIRDFYAERLVCSFWPVQPRPEQPAPFTGGDYPTVVLNADADPATPISGAYAVFDRAKNASLVVMQGGPHVIWGRGENCPDRIVFNLMLDGRKPEKREQVCKQDFLGPYVPLTAAKTGAAFGLAEAIRTELAQSPELGGWDGYDPLTVGCDFGGSLTATAARSGVEYTFDTCAWWPDLKISGDGVSIDTGDGTRPDGLTLDVKLSGAHQGTLTYRHDTSTGARSLSGDFDGKPVSTPRSLP